MDFVLYWNSAITAEITMKKTTSILIERTCFFSLIFLIILSLIRSSVRVDDEARTSEESVLIEAERTSITTSPISMGDRLESIVGIIESKPFAATSI